MMNLGCSPRLIALLGVIVILAAGLAVVANVFLSTRIGQELGQEVAKEVAKELRIPEKAVTPPAGPQFRCSPDPLQIVHGEFGNALVYVAGAEAADVKITKIRVLPPDDSGASQLSEPPTRLFTFTSVKRDGPLRVESVDVAVTVESSSVKTSEQFLPGGVICKVEVIHGSFLPPSPFQDPIISLLVRDTPEPLPATKDAAGDGFGSILTEVWKMFAPFVDLQRVGGVRARISQDRAAELTGNTLFPCGVVDGRKTVCASAVPIPAGGLVAIAATYHADIPLQNPEGHALIYAAVFDADGNPTNNYQAQPPFLNDFFQGTDRWYELVYDPRAREWRLQVSDARTGRRVPAQSSARAVLWRNVIVWFIPASEFETDNPRYRVTSFITDGRFSFSPETSGGDVAPGPPGDAWGLFELQRVP